MEWVKYNTHTPTHKIIYKYESHKQHTHTSDAAEALSAPNPARVNMAAMCACSLSGQVEVFL